MGSACQSILADLILAQGYLHRHHIPDPAWVLQQNQVHVQMCRDLGHPPNAWHLAAAAEAAEKHHEKAMSKYGHLLKNENLRDP